MNKIENGKGCGGNHLTPEEYHEAMSHPDAVMVDVRNFNESVIGKFQPPGTEVLDPMMRKVRRVCVCVCVCVCVPL